MSRPLLLSLLFLSLFTSCSGKPLMIIPSSSPLAAGVRGTVPASGSNCQYSLLGLVPLTGPPNTQVALSRAKAEANVEVLTDITVDNTSRYWILFSNSCVHVRGLGVTRQAEYLAQRSIPQ